MNILKLGCKLSFPIHPVLLFYPVYPVHPVFIFTIFFILSILFLFLPLSILFL